MAGTKQTTKHILMIRPANFGYNPQTAVNNAFQTLPNTEEPEKVRDKAIEEFNHFVEVLSNKGIRVHAMNDSTVPIKPDAIFPNNWITMHEDGTLVTYPMYSENRRWERRADIVAYLKENFFVGQVLALEEAEKEDEILEGTGSMVFDHLHKVAYACLSDRTNASLFEKLCTLLGYEPIHFTARDANQVLIYHTNVMMSVGTEVAIVCLDSIAEAKERASVMAALEKTGRLIIDIGLEQMANFAGNMLEIGEEKRYLVLSQTAFDSLTVEQRKRIESKVELLPIAIPYIEKYGGGSVRCMMAEIFLPSKSPL
jgi:hypothetical protein